MREHVPETGWIHVRANGLRHAVFVDGDGPLVLLQHGFPDTPHTWDDVVPHLVSRGFRVARPWGRGLSPSEKPTTDDYGSDVLGQDLAELIPALGASEAILVGHDWGASAVWAAAHLAPERIAKLVAVAIPHPATIKPSLSKGWGSRHFLANKMPWAARRFAAHDFAEIRAMYERWSPGFDWPDEEFEAAKNCYAAPGSLDAALGYYRALWGWPLRGRARCEALVIGGLTDGVLSAEDFERCPRRVEGSCRVEMLPGGHFLHREHPEVFLETLLEFLG